MNDEVDALRVCDTDLEQSGRLVGSDKHGEVVEVENSNWVSVGVKHVVVEDPVPARAGQDDRVHYTKLP